MIDKVLGFLPPRSSRPQVSHVAQTDHSKSTAAICFRSVCVLSGRGGNEKWRLGKYCCSSSGLVGCAFGGYEIGKHTGLPGLGLILGLLVGVIGVMTIACVPRTREAKVEAARRHYELQAEAARNAGYQDLGTAHRARLIPLSC
jgi:hypothetical protein